MKSSKKEFLVNVLCTILGIVIGVIMTYWSIKSSYDIAEKSGAFDKPDLAVYMGELSLDSSQYDKQIIFGSNASDSSILLSRIPLVIKNEGKETANKLSVTFRYPSAARLAFDSDVMKKSVYGRVPEKVNRNYSVISDFEYISYDISELNPGEVFTLQEPIFLPITEITDTLSIPDVYKGFVTNVVLSIPVNITITAEDVLTRDYEVQIISFDSKDSETFKAKVTEYLSKQIEKTKENYNSFVKIIDLFSNEKSTTIAEFLKSDTVIVGNSTTIELTANGYSSLNYVDFYH